MTKIELTEKTYNQPFEEVIKWYASLGYSKAATAIALSFNRRYFFQILAKLGLNRLFDPKKYNISCRGRGHGKGWPKGKSRKVERKYTDDQLLNHVRKVRVAWIAEECGPPNKSTIIRRFGSWNKAKQLAFGG